MNNEKLFCTLYVVRHGETEWNVQGLIQGHQGSPLTDEGRKQVGELTHALKHVHFDAVYSSDLLRAKDTAEMIARARKLAVMTTTALRERGYGTFEGKHKDEFEAAIRPLLKQFGELFDQEKNTGFLAQHHIESDQEVAQRVITYLREIAVAHAGQRVLVVTHGGVMRTLMVHLGFAHADQLGWGTIGNASYSTIASDGVDFFLREAKGIKGLEKKSHA